MSSILFVDDDMAILQLFSATFQHSCYQILTARSGDLALNILATETPDLMVFDVAMPMMGGDELLHRVRADERFSATPVIMLTAASNRITPELEAMVSRVLLKPISTKTLKEIIFSIIAPC